MNRLTLTLGLLVASLCVGCGKGSPVSVKGTVMYKDKPVPNVYVTIFNKDDDRTRGQGTTDESGKFSLSAPPGVYTLMITQTSTGNGAVQVEFPGKYSAYNASGHDVSVGWFGNDGMTIELTD